MLSDSSHEIRQQADSALSEFLQEIKNSPVRLLLVFCSLIVHCWIGFMATCLEVSNAKIVFFRHPYWINMVDTLMFLEKKVMALLCLILPNYFS